jgi:hypothetical protein
LRAAFAWGVPLTGNDWPATVEIEGQPPAAIRGWGTSTLSNRFAPAAV